MAPLPDVRLSYGPMLLGVFFNMILYGVFLAQLLTYNRLFCHASSPDGPLIKFFILYLMVLETANTALDMGMLYQPLILDYGQVPSKFPDVFVTQPILVVLVSTPIQFFFAWRIWKITNCVSPSALIALLATASLVGGFYTSARVILIQYLANKPELHTGALLWFLSSSCADVLITVCLVLVLSSRKTGFAATDGVIDRIIRTTIQTGLVTALFSILDVIIFETLPHDSVNFIFDLPLSKLYSNALLSTLNARPRLALSAASHGHAPESHRVFSVAYPDDEDGEPLASDAYRRRRARWRWFWGFHNTSNHSASESGSRARRDTPGAGMVSHQLVFKDMRSLASGSGVELDFDDSLEGRPAGREELEEEEEEEKALGGSTSSATAAESEEKEALGGSRSTPTATVAESEISETPRIAARVPARDR